MMMNNIITNLVTGRVSLISFILLCSVFTCENAFSGRKWEKSDMKVSYDQKNKSINLDFLFYEHNFEADHVQYLITCQFYYRAKGAEKLIPLMAINTRVGIKSSWIKILKNEPDDNILFSSPTNHPEAIRWPDGKIYNIEKLKTQQLRDSFARMSVKWDLSKSSKVVDLIHIIGKWKIFGVLGEEIISGEYPVTMDNTSALMPEISDRVKVTGELTQSM